MDSELQQQLREQERQAEALRDNGQRSWTDLTQTAAENAKQAATVTDEWVHRNPWLALGIAAGLGLTVGWWIAPRSKRD